MKIDFSLIEDLNQNVLDTLKRVFVGKNEIIDLLGICLVARENLFLHGPPGTAKSALVHSLVSLIHGKSFDYLLTRFTEPNELFGPFDIRKLREGELSTNTEGMLPEASIVFLDELLNANSAILNSLLMALNERVFRRGNETRKLPMLMTVGASNHLPEDDALRALYDRFLLRATCDYVDELHLPDVLDAGWKMEAITQKRETAISTEDISRIQNFTPLVDVHDVRVSFVELIKKLRNTGIKVSDRRAVKLQRVIAASALLSGRDKAKASDMWVLRYIWDTEDQQEVIAAIVQEAVDASDDKEKDHPRSRKAEAPNPEGIARDLDTLEEKLSTADIPESDRLHLRDQLGRLSNHSEWVENEHQREQLKTRIDQIWSKVDSKREP